MASSTLPQDGPKVVPHIRVPRTSNGLLCPGSKQSFIEGMTLKHFKKRTNLGWQDDEPREVGRGGGRVGGSDGVVDQFLGVPKLGWGSVGREGFQNLGENNRILICLFRMPVSRKAR